MPSISTDNVSEKLQFAINHNPHLFNNKFHFRSDNGRVVLQGSVNSYFEKQMAQEALRSIDGIGTIENELIVDES